MKICKGLTAWLERTQAYSCGDWKAVIAYAFSRFVKSIHCHNMPSGVMDKAKNRRLAVSKVACLPWEHFHHRWLTSQPPCFQGLPCDSISVM